MAATTGSASAVAAAAARASQMLGGKSIQDVDADLAAAAQVGCLACCPDGNGRPSSTPACCNSFLVPKCSPERRMDKAAAFVHARKQGFPRVVLHPGQVKLPTVS